MKQIIIRVFVAVAMCALTSVIRFTSSAVISNAIQAHSEAIWILRLILASVLSPLLYSFLDKLTTRKTIRAGNNSFHASGQSILSNRPSVFDKSV